jgi:membrane protease YdiL (CAAX protease family)
VLLFCALAVGLAWVAALPLWFGEGLRDPAAPVSTVVMTSMPALAAVLITVTRYPRHRWWSTLGLAGSTPWRRTLSVSALAAGATVVFSALALLLAAAAGSVDLRVGAITSVLLLPVMTVVFGLVAVGEEVGWRGYLHAALRPLGPVRMLLLSGVVWGAWHAPLLLLGSNYGTGSPVSIVLMVVSTVLLGALLAWLRERTGTMWAAAAAHGALNASITLLIPSLVAPEQVRAGLTLLGWPGWVVMAVVVAVLVSAGQFRWGQEQSRTASP